MQVIRSQNLDANESVFFARELEHIKAKAYDVVYPELQARKVIPVSYEAGPGAATITYEQYDMVGVAKIISSYANDLPRSDVKGKEFTSSIRSLGNAYGYSIQDIRSAQKAGKALPQLKANAARKANETELNRIAFHGDADFGLQGLLTHPNVTAASVAADGAGGGGSQTEWEHKTGDQILRDLNDLVQGIIDLTNGVERPDTVLLPDAQYGILATTARSSTSDTTLLEFFLKTNPYISEVAPLHQLKAAGPSGVDVVVVYKRDPEKLTLEIPQDFEQFPAQEKGLEFEIPCHSRCGGVIIYYPLSISIGEGI